MAVEAGSGSCRSLALLQTQEASTQHQAAQDGGGGHAAQQEQVQIRLGNVLLKIHKTPSAMREVNINSQA